MVAGFWAKLGEEVGPGARTWHPLEAHCADVAACFERLLAVSLVHRRLARLMGQEELDPWQVDRLGVLAFLHDAGKCNHGFQNKATPGASPRDGHLGPLMAALYSTEAEAQPVKEALRLGELLDWGEEDAGAELLAAAISHHGRPLRWDAETFCPALWRASAGRDPIAGLRGLVAAAARAFPRAFEAGGRRFPVSRPAEHLFSGLVMLADWLGSDVRLFPFAAPGEGDRMPLARAWAAQAMEEFGMAPARWRAVVSARALGFDQVSPFAPRPVQEAVLGLDVAESGGVVVVEAETGSGKTEAALARFVALLRRGAVDGMYFALPTRSAATQLHRRVLEAARRAFGEAAPPVVLAVPGYITADDHQALRLPGFRVLWDDARARGRGWAAEHPKRYLAGAIVVGTIDQVLLSALRVNHAHMRAAALSRHLLVIDEVHASDAYMTRLVEEVLAAQLAAGGHALLMSATLGAVARSRLTAPRVPVPTLAAAKAVPYPLLTEADAARTGAARERAVGSGEGVYRKAVEVQLQPWLEPDAPALAAIVGAALGAAGQGGRVLVIRNTVRAARATQHALEGVAASAPLRLRCRGVDAMHHSRFAARDRRALDEAVEAALGAHGSEAACVVVATQTVEQSLDLDADLLITDLCPMDVLLQRIGRLWRHAARPRPPGLARARVVVLVPTGESLVGFVRSDGAGGGANGLGSVYADLRVLELTWRELERRPEVVLPDDNRALVEQATHPEALAALDGEAPGWALHRNRVLGVEQASRGVAAYNTLDRRQPFGEHAWPDRQVDERIATRLGEDDRRVEFDPPVGSPFGERVSELRIPAWMARDVPAEAVAAEEVEAAGGVVTFRLGPRRYIYDRLGLRDAQEPAPGRVEEEEV